MLRCTNNIIWNIFYIYLLYEYNINTMDAVSRRHNQTEIEENKFNNNYYYKKKKKKNTKLSMNFISEGSSCIILFMLLCNIAFRLQISIERLCADFRIPVAWAWWCCFCCAPVRPMHVNILYTYSSFVLCFRIIYKYV